MSEAIINRSPDLIKLQSEDYRIEICSGYLIVHYSLNIFSEILFYRLSLYISYL